ERCGRTDGYASSLKLPRSERGATGFGITPVRCIQLALPLISGGPRVRRLAAGGRWIRTSGTADDARLLADLYTHNASRQMPQKGSSDQAVACLRRLGAGVVGSAAVCAFRFRPPGTGSKRAGWRRSGAIFAFFAAVCFEPDASRARLRFKAVMRSMTGGGAAISLGLTVSPFILASISRGVSAAVHSVRPLSDRTASDGNGRQQREADRHRRCQPPEARRGGRMSTGFADISWHTGCCGVCFGTGRPARGIRTHNATRHRPLHPDFYLWHDGSCQGRGGAALGVAAVRGVYDEVWTPPAPGAGIRGVRMPAGVRAPAHTARC